MPGRVTGVSWRLMAFTALVLLLVGVGVVLGLLIGHRLWYVESMPSAESVRSAVVQADQSVQLARVPVAEPGPSPHIIPKGAKEERRVRVVVQPSPVLRETVQQHATDETPGCSCDRIAVGLSLIRHRDGSSGIIASAEGGTVDPEASIDTPILEIHRVTSRNRLDLTVASRDRFAAAFMREYRPLDIPVSLGPAFMRWNGDAVIGISLSLPLQ